MQKLRLEIDALRVESFPTAQDPMAWTCGSTCICPSHHYTECNCGPGTYDLSCTCV